MTPLLPFAHHAIPKRAFRALAGAAVLALVLSPLAAPGQSLGPAQQRWGTYVGGTGADVVLSVAMDDFGHVYVAGRTGGGLLLGNDTTGQSGLTHQRHFGGGTSDAFLAKYAPQGAMLWGTYFGGTGDDEAVRVVVTGMNGVYLIGNTTSMDSVATDSLAFQQAIGGGQDVFVAHFTEHGALTGATYFGGPADETATGGALDGLGRLVVCAYANGPGAFPGGILPQQDWTQGEDGLLLALKSTAEPVAGTYIGGEGDDRLAQVAAGDSTGFVVLGNTSSATGIALGDGMSPALQGSRDAFLMKLDTSLVVQRGTYFGGEADDEGRNMVRRGDTLAIVGTTWSQALYTDSLSWQPANAGSSDGFLAVLDTALHLHWCTFIGDTGSDGLAGVAIDDWGGFHAAGTTTAIQPGIWPDSLGIPPGSSDAFMIRFSDADSVDWRVHVEAMNREQSAALAVMGHTAMYLGGRTSSLLGFGNNPHQATYGGGGSDGFAVRMDQKISTQSSGISTCTGGGGGDGEVNPPQNIFHVCRGDSIVFVAYGGALGYDAEWMWYENNCGVNEDFLTSGDTIVLFPDHNFTLFVRAEGHDHVTGCSYAEIVVHDIPQPVITVSDTVCAGTPITVHGTGAETFTWMEADSVVALGADTSFPAPMTGGTIHVVAAGTNGPACTVQVTVPVVVLPPPVVAWDITNIGCTGEPGAIALSMPDPGATDTAHWTFAWAPATLTGTTLTGLSAGLYVATITDTTQGCTATDSLHVLAPPTLGAHWQTTHISCDGQPGSIQLILQDTTALDSALTIIWAPSSLSGPVVSGLPAGNYIVNLSDTMGCSRTDTLAILQPASALASWQITATTCANSTDGHIALLQPDTAWISIAWAIPNLHGPVADDLAAGNYTVTVSDTMGCSRTEQLTVPAPPALMDSVGVTFAFCGQPVGTALVHSSSTAPGLAFDFGNGPSADSLGEQLPPGTWTVTATDSAGCLEQIAFTIATAGNITAHIGADTLLAENGTALLACIISPVDSMAAFVWTPATGLSEPFSPSTNCFITDTVLYVAHAASLAGCAASDSVLVIPWYPALPVTGAPCGDFFLPDHFSPNGDGLNDDLCLMGGCITAVEWNIHDRWGGRVFSSHAVDACWDGTRNGQALPAGTYLYTLHVERSTGEPIERTGTITLKR